MSRGRRPGRLVALASLALFAVPALSACADDAAISNSTYSYDPGDAAVDVDTTQLRAQKAEAGIPDCPKVDADAAAVDGGVPDDHVALPRGRPRRRPGRPDAASRPC